jgi:hypothetical protein
MMNASVVLLSTTYPEKDTVLNCCISQSAVNNKKEPFLGIHTVGSPTITRVTLLSKQDLFIRTSR